MANAKSESMIRNALTMMAGTFSSRILGLLREVITAACFGAGRSLDAFFVAYTIANLGRQLLAEGALSAAFVPVFSQVLERSGHDRAERLAREALTVILCVGTGAVLLGILLSPQLIAVIAPGFAGEKAVLAVSLTRQMFPFLLMISVAALAMGVLNSMNSFLVPALAPALSNLVYIITVVLTARRFGVESLVAAVLLGGAAQLLFQWWWAAHKKHLLLVPARPDRNDPELRRMMSLFLPYAAGLSLNQLNPVLGRLFGSFLEDGAISMLNYSNRVIQLPLGLVVIAISQAVLPELSRCAGSGDGIFTDTLRDALRFALFVILPVTLGTMLISGEAVNFLFYRGAFGEAAWRGTASTLFYSAIGLPGMACSTVVMRALFARSLPRQAMFMTGASVVGTMAFSAALVFPMGMNGVALASSLAFTFSSAVGMFMLRRSMNAPLHLISPRWAARTGISCAVMLAAGMAWKHFWQYPVSTPTWFRGVWILGIVVICAAVYAAVSWKAGCEEWSLILAAFHKKSSKRR
jgi:putative peptidoglycan lipid II flippase